VQVEKKYTVIPSGSNFIIFLEKKPQNQSDMQHTRKKCAAWNFKANPFHRKIFIC